MTSIC